MPMPDPTPLPPAAAPSRLRFTVRHACWLALLAIALLAFGYRIGADLAAADHHRTACVI